MDHSNSRKTTPEVKIFLQAVDIRQIYDKFPEKKGGLKELYDKGPQSAFFLVKFWVCIRQLLFLPSLFNR